eukprot:UN24307
MTDDILEYILHLFTPFCNQKRHFSNLIFLYKMVRKIHISNVDRLKVVSRKK